MSSPANQLPDREGDARRLFGLFSFLVAISLILHRLWWSGFEVEGLHFAVVLASFAVVLRPTSVPRFLLLIGAQVISVAVDMPSVGDHTLLIGIAGACVLAYAAGSALGTRRLPTAAGLFEGIAPFLRVSVVVLYAAAALSKMNETFFDAGLSCAAVMSSGIAWFDPSLLDGDWLVGPAIWGTVAVEASLPVLLAIPRTRNAGLVLGIGFHLVLALAGNVPFTAVMLALYVAFLPADLPTRARVALAGWPAGIARRARALPRWVAVAGFAAMTGCWALGAALADADPELAEALIDNGARLVIVAMVAAAAFLALAIPGRTDRAQARPSAGSLRLRHPVLAVGVALLILNAMSPYLGLKTASSFNMFSNLRTEPGYWNHAFVPEALRVFPYQDELAAGGDGVVRGAGLVAKVASFRPIPVGDEPSC